MGRANPNLTLTLTQPFGAWVQLAAPPHCNEGGTRRCHRCSRHRCNLDAPTHGAHTTLVLYVCHAYSLPCMYDAWRAYDSRPWQKAVGLEGAAASPEHLAANMKADGAAMVSRVLSREVCAAAQHACLRLCEECNLSHIFSSPTSSRAPPCAAECVWLCEGAFSAIARLECTSGCGDTGAAGGSGSGSGAGSGAGSGTVALRQAVDACALTARRALLAMGYAPADVYGFLLPTSYFLLVLPSSYVLRPASCVLLLQVRSG